MLQIQVNGKELDVVEQDLTLSWENIRFSQAIPDIYTTDCELPATPNNIEALGCYNLMERPQQYGQKIPAWITTEQGTQAGGITIDEVREDSIICTIYIGTLEGDVIDKPINQLVGDDSTTTLPFGGATSTMPTTGAANVGKYYFWQSERSRYMAMPVWMNAPIIGSIHVDYLLSLIGNAIGWTMPLFDNGYKNTYLIAMGRKRVRNTPLTMSYNIASQTWASQITIKGLSASASGNKLKLKVDEDCIVRLEICADHNGTNPVGVVVTEPDGTTHNYSWTNYDSYSSGYQAVNITLTSGQEFEIAVNNTNLTWTKYYMYIRATTMGQVAKEDDEYSDMSRFGDEVIDPTSTLVTPFPSWEYQGIIGNLAEISLRDLLSALCWQFGYRLNIDVNSKTISVAPADKVTNIESKATIVAMRPVSEKLGKHNLIKWQGEDRKPYDIPTAVSELLADEVTLYDLPFQGTLNRKGTDTNNVAHYALYCPAWEQEKDENGNWTLEVINEDWLPIAVLSSANYATWNAVNLAEIGQPQQYAYDYGFDKVVDKVLEVEIETYEDISDVDYVIVEGHRMMMIEGEHDGETGLNTAKLLLV